MKKKNIIVDNISSYVLNIEKSWEKKKQHKLRGCIMPCLYCNKNPVLHFKYNLCKECRKDFGHNYFRQL